VYLQNESDVIPNALATCDRLGVPPFMPCKQLDLETFEQCTRRAGGWLLRGQCSQAYQIEDPEYTTISFQNAFFLFVLLVCWIALACLAGTCRCACFCCPAQDDEALERVLQRAKEIDPQFASPEDRREDGPIEEGTFRIIYEAIMFAMGLMILDLYSVYAYVTTQNFRFAAVTFLVYLKALFSFYKMVGPKQFLDETRKSIERGFRTDKFLVLMHHDTTSQAVMLLVIQYYSLAFLMYDPMKLVTVGVSTLLSMRSVVRGVYTSIHLGVDFTA